MQPIVERPLWTRREALRRFRDLPLAALLVAGGVACGTSPTQGRSAGEASVVKNTVPSGQVARPRSVPGQFFCYAETLTADRPSVYGYLASVGCQPSSSFARSERIVFRFMVLDVTTAQYVTAEEATGVHLRLPFYGDMQADWKQRGEGRVADAPWTWDYCWDVPLDYPLGTLDYSVLVALKDGRRGEWKPPALVDPTRGIDTRPQIREQSA